MFKISALCRFAVRIDSQDVAVVIEKNSLLGVLAFIIFTFIGVGKDEAVVLAVEID